MGFEFIIGATIALASVYATQTFGIAVSLSVDRRSRFRIMYEELTDALVEIERVALTLRRYYLRGSLDELPDDVFDAASEANQNVHRITTRILLERGYFPLVVSTHYLSYWVRVLRYAAFVGLAQYDGSIPQRRIMDAWASMEDAQFDLVRTMQLHLAELELSPLSPLRIGASHFRKMSRRDLEVRNREDEIIAVEARIEDPLHTDVDWAYLSRPPDFHG